MVKLAMVDLLFDLNKFLFIVSFYQKVILFYSWKTEYFLRKKKNHLYAPIEYHRIYFQLFKSSTWQFFSFYFVPWKNKIIRKKKSYKSNFCVKINSFVDEKQPPSSYTVPLVVILLLYSKSLRKKSFELILFCTLEKFVWINKLNLSRVCRKINQQ